jgi:hypothetical protein
MHTSVSDAVEIPCFRMSGRYILLSPSLFSQIDIVNHYAV